MLNMFRKIKEKFNPERDTGQKTPVYHEIATGDVNDRYSNYPSEGLNPRKLAIIFKEADQGNVRRQMELYEDMEEKDPHLFSQLQTRKMAVTGLDWEVQPYSENEKDVEIADFVREQLKNIEEFSNVMSDMLDAIGKGTSVMELIWGLYDGYNIIEDIKYVPPKKLMWSYEKEELLICTDDFPSGISMPENKFVVHNYKAKSGHPSRSGVLRIVSWMYLFKNYTIKDWVAFCEVFGMPLRLGKYNQSASEDDKKELMKAIIQMGSDAAGIVPDTTMIEFIESNKTSTVDIYEKLARYCDEQISKAILGQTLTSDSGGGSYAQSKTHNEVRHDLTAADARSLEATIRRDIIRPLVYYNFGSDWNIPMFLIDTKEDEDQKELSEVYRTLITEVGLPVSQQHLYKKFGIPRPNDDEECVKPFDATISQTPQYQLKTLSDKPEYDSLKEQKELDRIVTQCCKNMSKIFDGIAEVLKNETERYETLEDLQAALSDKENLTSLYEEIDSPELRDLLHQSMYLSALIGRTQE